MARPIKVTTTTARQGGQDVYTHGLGGFGIMLTWPMVSRSSSKPGWQCVKGESPGTARLSSRTLWSLPKNKRELAATREERRIGTRAQWSIMFGCGFVGMWVETDHGFV